VSSGMSYYKDEMQNFKQEQIHDEKCTYVNLYRHQYVAWEV